jgi:DNA-binding CsgD family transcriptional regulator
MSFNMQTSLEYDGRSLSDCDHCVLNLLGPCLQHIDEVALHLVQFSPIFVQLKQALEQGGVVCLASNAEVQFMTPRANKLIQMYFPDRSPNLLPDLLEKKLKHQLRQAQPEHASLSSKTLLRVEQQRHELLVHLLQDPEQKYHFLLLEEKATNNFSINTLELLGLTRREAEVLFWVAKDKSNAAIARSIGCCEGTVRKHLENIYKKLDVQTRIGAVMAALQKLGLLREESPADLQH